MNIEKNAELGLSTAEALKKLHDDISNELNLHERQNKWKHCEFDKNNRILSFYSVFITILLSFGLVFTGYYLTAIFVLFILVINVIFVYREEKLKHTEMIRKTREILDDIELAITLSKDWNESNYPHLVCPMSPCISLCWTYRDHEIKNLPTGLLVEGDIIVLRLGQIAPGNCHEINSPKPRNFIQGETYGYDTQHSEAPNKPMAIQPLPDLLCVIEHTPFIDNLRHSLSKFLNRPQTSHNHQRHVLINTYLQKYVFGIVLVIVIVTIILRSFDSYFIRGKQRHKKWEDWAKACILNCVSSLISLLPLIFPLLWINLHHWGSARLNTLLAIPQPQVHKENTKASPEMDTPTSVDLPIIPRQKVFSNYMKILMGSCDLLSRSTNIIQVLGSVSAFCCVDKKGILSWPNPTPEKVFFLRDKTEETAQSESSFASDNMSDQEDQKEVVAEVLDLTHDQQSPFKLEFDDHEWKNHLKSLKPLGKLFLHLL